LADLSARRRDGSSASALFRSRVGGKPAASPALVEALKAGQPVDVPADGIAADSLVPKRVGELMFPIAQRYVADIVLVSDDAIREAQRTLRRVLRLVTEPGGAAAFAVLLSGAYRLGKRQVEESRQPFSKPLARGCLRF
jgi:threonine dehydratase